MKEINLKTEIIFFNNYKDCHHAIGSQIAASANQRVLGGESFSIALSGGKTPAALFQDLSASPMRENIPWRNIHFFWGDERSVPQEHPDSNFFMAHHNLFKNVHVPEENIFRMPADIQPLDEAASLYEATLQKHLSHNSNDIPSFDLVMLGMGPDGHTASLFPDHSAINCLDLVVDISCETANPQVPRLSLTLKAINNADTVLFMISGKEKIDLIHYFKKYPDESQKIYPAAMVKPLKRLLWYVVDDK